MAGGIDWFRWHHGSVTDPKFQLVARKSGASLPDVLAVWAYLLEKASASDFRGSFGDVDVEAVDCLFGFEDGTTNCIMGEMVSRKLIADEYIVAWEKRQPKREDETAAERKRRQREREHELAIANAVTSNESQLVTQCHADVTQCHDRGEESREEVIEPNGSVASKLPTCPTDAVVQAYHAYLPELPAVRLLNDSRKKAISSFWRWVLTSKKTNGEPRATDSGEALEWINAYFIRASENDFLMGRHGSNGKHAAWKADLDFLLTEKGKRHVIEKTEGKS